MIGDKSFWESAMNRYKLSLRDLEDLQLETFDILVMEGMGGLEEQVKDTGVFLMVGDRTFYRA